MQHLRQFYRGFGGEKTRPGQIPTGTTEACDEAKRDGIAAYGKYDRDGRCRRLGGQRPDIGEGGDDVNAAAYQIGRERRQAIGPPLGPAILDGYILTIDKARLLETLRECQQGRVVTGGWRAQKANHRHRRLLCARRERPRRRRAAEESDEFPPAHSITSSARKRTTSGTCSPSALAVFMLSTVSYLVGACTGRSAGFWPLSMRST